ncbi:unnamed protein product [Durusdinium trenchii]|uniref:Uncharacterized protein n=1 Tax=Durusdinium trenchii TaxID=1381693 RepID=A0ABP0IIJ2_9DINO
MSRNKMDAREGSPPHLDTFRQDLVTMNVRMERILEAQTSKVADAAAQAVRSQLEPVEQLIAQMQTQLLPLRHLQTSPLPGAVDAQELCIEPRSQSRLRSIAKKAFPRMLPPEEVCPPRMEQGIQTDAEAQPTHKHAKTHAILKEIGTGSIGCLAQVGMNLFAWHQPVPTIWILQHFLLCEEWPFFLCDTNASK